MSNISADLSLILPRATLNRLVEELEIRAQTLRSIYEEFPPDVYFEEDAKTNARFSHAICTAANLKADLKALREAIATRTATN
jgi:hypothetical protein